MDARVEPADYTGTILEWWHVLVFMGTLVIGFILGNAKQRWTQEQLQQRVISLEHQVRDLSKELNSGGRDVLIIKNELTHISLALVDIKTKLEQRT